MVVRKEGACELPMRLRGGARARTTLSDVARKAGVSPITVSRALREPHKVSDKLRETILGVVDEIGYVPNFAARALASRHSGIIAVLGPVLGSPGFSPIASGIEDRFQAGELRTQFANIGLDASEEARQLNLFVAQNPAGIIMESVAEFPVNRPLIDEIDCPVVQMMDTSLEPLDMGIGVCHRSAAKLAVRHLLSKGYSKIALLGGNKDIRSRRRFEGYREALSDAGLYEPGYIFDTEGRNSVADGHALMRCINSRYPEIDAVFCHDDELALGALFAASQLGLRVPEDLGICGYNGLHFSGVDDPPLTSVSLPLYEIGFKAAEMLMAALAGGERKEGAVELEVALVEGASTRR